MDVERVNTVLSKAIIGLQDGEIEGLIDEMKAGKLGKPDVIHGMKYGGTRYKYDWGVFIDAFDKTGEFKVYQAGRPSKLLGTAKSLDKAKEIARKKADFN